MKAFWRKFLIGTIREDKGPLLIARLLRSWRGKSLLDSIRWRNLVLWKKIYQQWTKVLTYRPCHNRQGSLLIHETPKT